MFFWDVSEIDHRILNPLSDEKLVLVGRCCRLSPDSIVIDLGCGKGEALCRWAGEFGARGLGVDIHEGFVAAARSRATELGVDERVRVEHADASGFHSTEQFDVGVCLGASRIGGGVSGTIGLLRQLVRPHALVAVGEVFFHERPPPGTEDPLASGEAAGSLSEVVSDIERAGAEVIDLVVASSDDWDRYQATQWHNVADWLEANPDHPQAEEFRANNERWKRAYLSYGRRRWGWAVFIARLR